MFGVLVSFILLIQGIPVQRGGTVTGVLRDGLGMPVPGVRMAAVARPDPLEEAAGAGAMAGIAETDAQGRFTLEDIPPGRYYIAAGRLDLQTYYPGTQEMSTATVVTIAAGETVSGINFVLDNTSFGRSPTGSGGGSALAVIPVRVSVENGGKLPISADGKFTFIHLESSSANPVSIPIESGSLNVPGPVSGYFRVTIENLPDTYVVRGIAYGSTDITQGTFRLTPANFPAAAATRISSGLAPTVQAAPAIPPATISIQLGEIPQPSKDGVRVAGRIGNPGNRLVYISGRPGTLFSDGTFEFRGVPPGRHLIATVNNSSMPMAAVIVVGEKDLNGVGLQETPLLPADVRVPKDPQPAGSYMPGTTVPLARVSGVVVEEVTKAPIMEGEVVVRAGDSLRTTPIDASGHFETFYLLPGTYDLRLQIFGHSTNGPTITIEDKDIRLELTSRRLY